MTVAGMSSHALATGAEWFAVTLGLSTYANTAFLKAGGTAAGHTLARIGGATLFGTLLQLQRLPAKSVLALLRSQGPHFALPAAALFLANYFNSISLARCGITVTYVTKAATPVATIALCSLGWGKLPVRRALAAVPAVILGVALSVWGNSDFEAAGFAAAVLSTVCQALVGVSVRAAILDTGMSGAGAHWLMCSLVAASAALAAVAATAASACVTAASAVQECMRGCARGQARLTGQTCKLGRGLRERDLRGLDRRQAAPPVGAPSARAAAQPVPSAWAVRNGAPAKPMAGGSQPARVPLLPLPALRLLTAIAFYSEYSRMFAFSASVDSVTLSVSDTIRRSAIVYAGRLMFGGDSLSRVNMGGIAGALAGAMAYAALASR